MKRTLLLLSGVLLAATLLTGCVAVVGNTDAVRKTTIGQELIDLKKALDAGLITEQEYETQKSRLLKDKK